MRPAMLILTLILTLCAGCCPVLRQTAGAVSSGVEAADDLLPDEADDDLAVAHGVAELGEAAARGCVDDAGWQQFVALGLEATNGLIQLFTGAADDEAPDPPSELLEAHELLEAQQ